jgi:hypothetical protein
VYGILKELSSMLNYFSMSFIIRLSKSYMVRVFDYDPIRIVSFDG